MNTHALILAFIHAYNRALSIVSIFSYFTDNTSRIKNSLSP